MTRLKKILLLIDFSKAFDTVSHSRLLQKLKYYFGFSKYSSDLIRSYLRLRTQAVINNKNTSYLKQICSGVPQGSILGPIFFSMFINDVVCCCKFSKIHLYADDVQIYFSNPSAELKDLVTFLNSDLSRISVWSEGNCLKINNANTKSMSISHHQIETAPKLILKDSVISFVSRICVSSNLLA